MIERRAKDRRAIPRSEAILDAAVEYTFPASDPISIDHAFDSARRREDPALQAPPAPRSPASAQR